MEKIYSRKRFKRINKKNKFIILIIVITLLIAYLLNKVIYPLFSKKCVYKAKVIVTQVSNEETEKIMQNYTYKDLVHIEEDSEGNVTFLESNVFLINKIKSNIINNIQKIIKEKKEKKK